MSNDLVTKLAIEATRTPERRDRRHETLSILHSLIIEGLPGISQARRLIFIPDGPLDQVPFEALRARKTGRSLDERSQVYVARSLALAVAIQTTGDPAPRGMVEPQQ